MEPRKYEDYERPRTGDVVECFSGSFGDAVITRCYRDRQNEPMFDLERPHASVRMGTLTISIERIDHVTLKSLRENYRVYPKATGGIENRSY